MYICFSASPVAPRWAKITYLPARHFARLITRTQCASHHSFRNTLVRLLLLKSTVHVLSNRHTHALAPSEKWLPTTINFAFLNTPWLSPTLSLTHVPPPLVRLPQISQSTAAPPRVCQIHAQPPQLFVFFIFPLPLHTVYTYMPIYICLVIIWTCF